MTCFSEAGQRWGRRVAVLLVVSALVVGCGDPVPGDVKDDTLRELAAIREQTKEKLIAHVQGLHRTARSAAEDTVMLRYFRALSGSDGAGAMKSDELHGLDRHYVAHYGGFYDLLMIDSSGHIFHTIRQESDFHTHLFSDTLSTSLARSLATDPTPSFVDFEYYRPSREPAAFHVVPVMHGTVGLGWMVFQQAINKVNSILTGHRGLGRTGEVYLVNGNGLMLTESRFIKEPTILRKKINTEAVEVSRAVGKCSRLIEDYRGVPVFSSSEMFDVLGSSWVIVAEIDESEVITDMYRAAAAELSDSLRSHLASVNHPSRDRGLPTSASMKVDMDEFGMARPGESISTWGVATCTAVSISYRGRFSYLAHIVPLDRVVTTEATRLFLDNDDSDLLGALMDRIYRYDIYPYELANLRVTIVATHDESFLQIVNRLTDFGIDLSQIKVMYNPAVESANVRVEPSGQATIVEWIEQSGRTSSVETDSLVASFESVVKEVSGYNRM